MIPTSALRKQRLVLLALVALLAAAIALGLTTGPSPIALNRILPTLFGGGDFKEEFVLYSIRLPRIAISFLAGLALALSGSILQGVLRNDLADPGILGINAGAGFAIACWCLFAPIDAGAFAYVLPLIAFAGAAVTGGLIYVCSADRRGTLQPTRLILVGVGFSMALSGAMVVLISSAERAKVDFIAKWLAGSLWGTDWPFIWALLPWLVALVPFALWKARTLDLLSVGEETAVGLGVSLHRDRIALLATAVALAAAAVSVAGSIAFIGLMAPHLARALVGPRHRLFLPVALALGGWLLIAADWIGRQLALPDGIPAGIVASIIGAPYFLYLLAKGR